MIHRAGVLAVALAGALLYGGIPSHAADEPVATAPIPPPPEPATPMVVPLPHAAAAPAKPATKAARPIAGERKHAKSDRRKPAVRNAAAEAGKRAERTTSRHPTPERRAERQQASAARELPRPTPQYPPGRYYSREEIQGPPGPPPWYERGPPFAAMPYPRGMMRPW